MKQKLNLVLIISAFCFFKIDSLKAQVNTKDSLALVDLYNSTNGKTWKRNTNWLKGPVKTWYGITVVDSSVTEIYLYQNNLQGVLPLSFGNLTNLYSLEFGYNNLQGPIPVTIGNLVNLLGADLNENNFNDTIPASIGNCKTLASLNLYHSHIIGRIPSSIGNCTSLMNLSLYGNQIEGEIPSSIGRLIHLSTLRLSMNSLTGKIPDSIGYCLGLYELDLSFNKLTGPIPASLGNLVNLYYLYLYSNRLSGLIPSSLGNLKKVFNFILNGNNLSGTIPSSLGGMLNVGSIELQSNKLTGNIPSSLAELNNLYGLLLDDNALTGSIPAAFAKPGKHINLSVSYNHLSQVGNVNFSNFSNPNFFSYIDHNWFTFDGLEFVAVHLPMVHYSPQAKINVHQHDGYLSVYAGGTLSNNTYQWSKDGVIVKTVQGDSTYHPTTSGNYTVKITNSIAKKLTLYSDTFYIASLTATTKTSALKRLPNGFSIYPNPAKTNTTITYNSASNGSINLTNASGNLLQTVAIPAGSHSLSLDVSKYAKGIYFVSLIDDNRQTQTLKLIKE